MKKKILISFIFFSFFFINPKPALADENFFTSLGKLFLQLFGLVQSTTKDYIPATVNNRQDNTKFSSDHNDISTRAVPASTKAYNTGVWLYEVVTEKTDPATNQILYPDLDIKITDNPNCKDMKLSDMVYFYQQKFNSQQLSEKILYQRGNLTPIEYSNDLKLLKNKSGLINSDDCYFNAYLNIQSIPRQNFEKGNSGGGEDGITLSSNQLNDTTKLSTPYNFQGETIPTESNSITAKTIAKNTDIQDRNALLNIIPKQYQDLVPCGETTIENREHLFTAKNCLNTPASWGAKECSFSGVNLDISNISCDDFVFIDPDNPDKEPYKGGVNPGMSQLGAHGMALSGFFYKQLLTSYLGDVTTIVDNNKLDENLTMSVWMATNYGGGAYSGCENIGGKLYKPDLTNGTGGFKLTDQHKIEECTREDYTEITENYTDQITGEVKTKIIGYKEKIPNTCLPFLQNIPMYNYLLGVSETSSEWHIQYQKAHMIICRQGALNARSGSAITASGEDLGTWVYNDAKTQAFRCDEVGAHKGSNQDRAIKLTDGEFVVNKNNGAWASDITERSYFCGPNSTTGFNGYKYEKISKAYSKQNISSSQRINGICFEGVAQDIQTFITDNDPNVLGATSNTSASNPKITRQPTKRSSSVTASLIDGLYTFNDSSHHTRIKENYDLIDVDGGKWLTSYPNQNNCHLDSRVIPALSSLINTISQEIPDNQLIPQNCYRDFDTQYQLWQEGLSKYHDIYTNLIWHSYPGTSIHQTGRVIDFYDKFGQLDKNSSVYQWLIQNGARFGFYHHPLEPWHWEYNP